MTSLRTRSSQSDSFLTWISTARKHGSRIPQRASLRFIEHVSAGIEFDCEFELYDASLWELLENCIDRTDCLGGNRNRGGGLVKITKPPVIHQHVRNFPQPDEKNYSRLRVIFKNLEPLCLPITGFPGNIIPTFGFIRGQVLRGAIISWALRQDKNASLLLGQNVSIGDAIPLPYGVVSESNLQGLLQWDVAPIPLNVGTRKPCGSKDNGMPWWAKTGMDFSFLGDNEEDVLEQKRSSPYEKLKRPKPYEYLFSQSPQKAWIRYEPEISVHMRNQVPRDRKKDKTELFSVEEIAENTLFMSEIRFNNKEDADAFYRDYLSLFVSGPWITIGRGRRPIEVIDAHWLPALKPLAKNQDTFSLTLESDLIVRGPNLGFYNRLDVKVLKEATGISIPGSLEAEGKSESVEVMGFNAASGLPRAPAIAIRRGSYIVTVHRV